MNEPTTKAGRAAQDATRILAHAYWVDDATAKRMRRFIDAIDPAAIEAEAREQERERIAAAVRGLRLTDLRAEYGAWGSIHEPTRAAVLAAIEEKA
jgi:hypothetical protein